MEMKTRTLYEAKYNGMSVRVYKTDSGEIVNYDTQDHYPDKDVDIGNCIEDKLKS